MIGARRWKWVPAYSVYSMFVKGLCLRSVFISVFKRDARGHVPACGSRVARLTVFVVII